jgi:putative membrane protein
MTLSRLTSGKPDRFKKNFKTCQVYGRLAAGWTIGGLSLLVALVVAGLLLIPPGQFLQILPWQRADVVWLPHLNAGLNGTNVILLTAAYRFIRRRQVRRHRFCMLAAFGLSAFFLVSYVVYHAVAGATQFSGAGWSRSLYLAILVSHIVLAILVLPLVLTTLYRAWQGTFAQHRRLARWTLPIWLYVSGSGVVVYWLLYQWN